jgi:hypothetical protein
MGDSYEKLMQNLSENLKERDHLGETVVYRRTVLDRKKWSVRKWSGFIWLRTVHSDWFL